MLDVSKLPASVREDIVQNRDWEALPREEQDRRLSELSVEDAFDHYCEWNGLIGWASQLAWVLDAIRMSEKPS